MTIGSQPSLKSTQAVGAVLLRQFTRDRFIQAGVNEEEIESLNHLTANFLQDDEESSLADLSRANKEDDSYSEQNSTDNPSQNSRANNGNDGSIYHSFNNGRTPGIDDIASSPAMVSYGRELRLIAEEFERTRLRQVVRQRANEVQLEDINKENFYQLLEELFQPTITREKIAILFFFCTDVALRAASSARKLVVKLMSWSFSYIINTICKIVHDLGGWDKVFFYQLPSLLVSFAAIGVCILAISFHKSLRSSWTE